MPKVSERRYSRWYEVIIFSSLFQFSAGFVVVVLLPNMLFGDYFLFGLPSKGLQLNTLLANSVAYGFSSFILHKFRQFPGTRSLPFIIPTVLTTWLLMFAVFLLLREESYSRPVLLTSFVLANIWAFLRYAIGRRYAKPKLALVPFGRALELADTSRAIVTVLEKAQLNGRRYDGIVADLHCQELPREWTRFLARCTLAGIPVLHTQQLIESLTGRVRIDQLSENGFGNLQPSPIYNLLKRTVDFIAVFLFLPIFVPIMLVTAIAIKLDSKKDSIFYTQKRMGYRGKPFTMYKFRSMRSDVLGKGFTAGEEDPRITRVGTFIRKYRIDELPQILNVLKGQMSFIGPRPESSELSQWYEQDVAFFSYRHIVRPGLSGWAQVNQGYAAEVDGMTIKLQYDFYYIKNFSLWLDLLIVARTLRTILTGFGAR